MDTISASVSSGVTSWENIKETALQTKNLTADIRVGAGPASNIDVIKGFLGRAKAFFGFVPTKAATTENLKAHLSTFFTSKVAQLLPKEPGASFDDHVKTALEGITSKLEKNINAYGSSTSAAIQEAHAEVQEVLFNLKKDFCAQPDSIPQMILFDKKNDEGVVVGKQICMIRPAAAYENIALSGGGKKGEVYGSVYEVLSKVGALKELKHLAGSSAGSIPAAGIACGMNPAEFKKAQESLEWYDFFTGSQDADIKKAVSVKAYSMGGSGTKFVEKFNAEISTSIRKFLDAHGIEKLPGGTTLSDEEGLQLAELRNNLQATNTTNTYMVTFKDLALLRKIAPDKFKELTITGYNATTKEIEYYSTKAEAGKEPQEEGKSMPIATAVRISMALPFFLKSIEDDGQVRQDGGLASNLPVDALDPETRDNKAQVKEFLEQTKAQNENVTAGTLLDAGVLPTDVSAGNTREKTLVLAFDKKGAFSRVAKNTDFSPTTMDRIKGQISNAGYYFSNTADKIKLWHAGPNALNVLHGELGTVSFLASQKTIDASQLQAKTSTWDWAAARQDQATYEVFDLEKLPVMMKSMSNVELEAMQQNPNKVIADAACDELKAR